MLRDEASDCYIVLNSPEDLVRERIERPGQSSERNSEQLHLLRRVQAFQLDLLEPVPTSTLLHYPRGKGKGGRNWKCVLLTDLAHSQAV
jgi:hypothetical protein